MRVLMGTANPAVLPTQHEGSWRLMCCCQEGVKARASLQRATLPGTETSFSCCRSHREGFCSPGTDISCRPGRESLGEPGSAGTGPQALPPRTPGWALLWLERAVGHLTCALQKHRLHSMCSWAKTLLGGPRSVGPSPRGSVGAGAAPWHALGATPQRVGARSGVCTHAPMLVLWVLGAEKGD